MTIQMKNVVVIGGGMAGIGAAIDLSKRRNVHVTLIEARDRLGGRISTLRNLIPLNHEIEGIVPQGSSDIAFDFGASWIHGVDPSNPLFPLIQLGHVEHVHTDSDVMYLQPGHSQLLEAESNQYWKIVWDILDEAREYSEKHCESIPESLSLKDWLIQYIGTYQSEDPESAKYMSELTKSVVHGLAMYWADENAIPMDKVSVKYMDSEDIFPGDHCLVTNGFDRVIKALATQLKDVRVLLEHVVEKIEYSESEVKVLTNHGSFTADQVLVTLPLGVLKSQSSTLFSPKLPSTKQHAITHLGFGTMFKIILIFPKCFWPTDKHFINFLPSIHTKQPDPNLVAKFGLNDRQEEALTAYMQDMANYSSFMPVYNVPILVGYATNRAAELMERLLDEEARMVYLCQLAHYFEILTNDDDPEQGKALWPKVSFMSRWHQDPFARGSYTSIPIGAAPADILTFQIPVGARTYGPLMGDDDYEHCDDINPGPLDLSDAILTSVDDLETGRVFFAGEHTSAGHFASVQGALMSGRLGAARILSQHSIPNQ
ncbi:hypothetical protein BGZ76_010615 [Entomortierella beljakovae]|nr:hypothetical protein BGZ76_010615 [Entomortierella beljakovae]